MRWTAEGGETSRIAARRVYEIRNGELGRLYRDGGIMADSRDYLMNVDAVGSDFRLYPIPNCGKGQPMQTKRLGNGGPTARARPRGGGGQQEGAAGPRPAGRAGAGGRRRAAPPPPRAPGGPPVGG